MSAVCRRNLTFPISGVRNVRVLRKHGEQLALYSAKWFWPHQLYTGHAKIKRPKNMAEIKRPANINTCEINHFYAA